MKGTATTASSLTLAAIALIASACRPDASTPEKAAAAFVEAMNSGSLKKFERIAGEDAIEKAVRECETWKTKELPVVSGYGWERDMRQAFRGLAEGRKSQDCSKIAEDLEGFLSYLSKTPGMKVRSVEAPSLKDGVERAEVALEPPDWSGRREQIDTVIFVKGADGRWVPDKGELGATPIANYLFALVGAARGHVDRQLGEILKN